MVYIYGIYMVYIWYIYGIYIIKDYNFIIKNKKKYFKKLSIYIIYNYGT